MVAPSSKFYGKIWVGFRLNNGKRFFLEFHFKANRKSIGSSKKVLEIFLLRIALRLRDWHVFMWQSLKIEKRFQYFKFETDFLENENHFQKTAVPFFSWKQ